jgi:hypothetical protein
MSFSISRLVVFVKQIFRKKLTLRPAVFKKAKEARAKGYDEGLGWRGSI